MDARVRLSARELELRAWVEGLVGGEVVRWERLVSGNSRTTWTVDVERSSERLPLVVRVDPGDGPFSGTPLTLDREAAIYLAMQDRGVALPRTYGFDAELAALALERVHGAAAWDDCILAAVLEELGRLHAVDPADLPGDWVGVDRSTRTDIELWAAIARDRVHPPSPFVDFAVRFLLERFPGEPERHVVVHGDAGPGNVLWDGSRITALLDWELAHLGDPYDDLAFLSVRSVLFGIDLEGFGARVREHYMGAAGISLDETRFRYWQAVGLLRNLVTCLASISNPVRGRDRLVHHMLVPSLNSLLVRSLAEIEGITLDPAPALTVAAPLPGTEVVGEVADGLRQVIDALDAEEPRQRARRMRHLLLQLGETLALAPEVARLDARDMPTESQDVPSGLQALSRIADRRLAVFPRAATLAGKPLPGLS